MRHHFAVGSAFLLVCLTFLSSVSLAQSATFTHVQRSSNGEPATEGDLNGDGILDLINPGPKFTFDKNGFYVQLSNPTGSYKSPAFYTSPYLGNPVSVAVGDVNGDGQADVIDVEGTHDYYIFLNAGNGQLLPSWNVPTDPDSENQEVGLADFNGDGKLDLVMVSQARFSGVVHLQILFGKGNGTFSAPITIDPNAEGGTLLIGDYDGDGKPDLAATVGHCSSDVGCFTHVRVYYSDGKGGFSAPVIIDDPTNNYSFRVANDIDQDGRSDLIGNSGQTVPQPVVRILHGKADRTFEVQDVPLATAPPPDFVPVEVADFNGDGIKDLATIENDANGSSIVILPGSAGGSFGTEQVVYASPHYLHTLQAGRYNGDTRPDLVASYPLDGSNYNTRLHFLRNTTKNGIFPGCAPPAASEGIAVCSLENGSEVKSPAHFRVGAAFTSPLRKTELWIDGVKVAESFISYATYSFLDGSFALPPGPHRADIYSAAYDNRLQHQALNFTITK